MRFARIPVAVAGAALAAIGALAAPAIAQTTTKSSSAGSCPNPGSDTAMTSDAGNSKNGYLCAFEYHDGDRSIGGGESQTFSQTVNVAYYPQYYCWTSSDQKDLTYAHAEIFGGGSVSATNWGTGGHTWGAGYLYTLGASPVTGFTNGCTDGSQVWQNWPNIGEISSISATGLPDNGASAAGTPYTVTVTVGNLPNWGPTPPSPAAGAQVALKDNGVNVAGGVLDSTGTATISWTPAQMGSHNIQVGWGGLVAPVNFTGAGPALTDPYTVTVSGGVAVSIDPTLTYANGVGSANVSVDTTCAPNTTTCTESTPIPVGTSVVLIDANTKAAVSNPTKVTAPATGSFTSSTAVNFGYKGGQSYKLIARVLDASKNVLGQSYVVPFNPPIPPTVVTPTFPTSTVYVSNLANYTCRNVLVPTTIQPSWGTGTVSVSTTGFIADDMTGYTEVGTQNGSSTARWCPPTSPGTYSVTVNYAGDSSSNPGSSKATTMVVASGGYTPTLSGPTGVSSNTCQLTVSVSGGVDGSPIYVSQFGANLGSGTLSGGSGKVQFPCTMGVKYNYLQGVYQSPARQLFPSANASYTFSYSGATEYAGAATAPTLMEQPPRPATAFGAAALLGGGQAANTHAGTRRPLRPRGNPGISSPGSLGSVETGARSVTRSARITARRTRLTANCPKGYYPLHEQGATTGPDTAIGASFSGRKVTFTSPPANIGHRMSAQVTCRAYGALAQVVGAMAYGTRGRDSLSIAVPGGTVFAGPGGDRVRVLGNGSSAWGGLGDDRMAVAGRDSVAAGGPGRDRIIAIGKGRKLLWGGRGPDLLVGGPGVTVINAKDGRGHDRIICRSPANRVLLDPGDRTSGPCRVISAG